MTAECPIIMLSEIFICIKAFNDFLGFHNSDQRKYLRQRGDPSIELGLTPDKTSCTRKIKSEAITAVTALFAGFLPGSKPVWLVISQKSNVFNLATSLNWGNNFQRYRHHLSHLEEDTSTLVWDAELHTPSWYTAMIWIMIKHSLWGHN